MRTPKTFPHRPVAPRVPSAVDAKMLRDARPIAFDIAVELTVDEVLSGDALREENVRLGIPPDTPPTLKVWSSNMRDRFGQRGVELVAVDEKPARRVFEPENSNEIFLWDFSGRAAPGATFSMKRTYEATMHLHAPDLSATTPVADYNTMDPVYLFYTKTEPFVELTPEIRAASREALANKIRLPILAADGTEVALDRGHPLARARAMFEWVRGHMTYVYPPPTGRGCLPALEQGKGDCGQYADLFVALCRADGIPARFVGGLVAGEKRDDGTFGVGSHAWAEIMMPDGQWLQMDPTREATLGFGRLETNEAMTMSVGRNIPLPDAPNWARSEFSDVDAGRTDFMQTYTILATGMRVSEKVSRSVRER